MDQFEVFSENLQEKLDLFRQFLSDWLESYDDEICENLGIYLFPTMIEVGQLCTSALSKNVNKEDDQAVAAANELTKIFGSIVDDVFFIISESSRQFSFDEVYLNVDNKVILFAESVGDDFCTDFVEFLRDAGVASPNPQNLTPDELSEAISECFVLGWAVIQHAFFLLESSFGDDEVEQTLRKNINSYLDGKLRPALKSLIAKHSF